MKKIISILLLSSMNIFAQCPEPTDLLVVGDSQTGASWSRSYFGDFVQSCLKGSFAIYGRGGSIAQNWYGKGGLDTVETVERTPAIPFHIVGVGAAVPFCKKRMEFMIDEHKAQKVLYFFGDNYISSEDSVIIKDINQLMNITFEKGIASQNCFFLAPTYEMQVATKRNVSRKYLANTQRINAAIKKAIGDRCQVLDGLEIMKSSPYFDGKELLKRVQIEGKIGCAGAATNDNIHICGMAAKDLAQRVCDIVNHSLKSSKYFPKSL
jgi:hypothetical protein